MANQDVLSQAKAIFENAVARVNAGDDEELGDNQFHFLAAAAAKLMPLTEHPEIEVIWHRLVHEGGKLGPQPAICLCQEWLRSLNNLQTEKQKWQHRGMPYYYIWLHCRNQKWDWHSRWFALLTLLEDVLRDMHGDRFPSETSNAYKIATFDFAVSQKLMDEFGRNVKQIAYSYPEHSRWPELIFEEVLSKCRVAQRIMNSNDSTSRIEPLIVSSELLRRLRDNQLDIEVATPGEQYERLAAILAMTIPGAVVRRDRKGTFQNDVLVDISSEISASLQLGPLLVFECKNWNKPADINVAAKLLASCQMASSKFGVIFSKKGITGSTAVKGATKVAIHSYLQFGVGIVVITEKDIDDVIESGNFLGLLKNKLAEARVGIF